MTPQIHPRLGTEEQLQNRKANVTDSMVYVATLATHIRLLISIITTHVGFTFHCRQTKGVYPSCAPPLLCQLNNRIFETCSLNVWDCFLSNFTSTAAGRTVCRSAKQFVSALSPPRLRWTDSKIKHIVCREWLISPGEPGRRNRVCLLLLKQLPVGLQRPF